MTCPKSQWQISTLSPTRAVMVHNVHFLVQHWAAWSYTLPTQPWTEKAHQSLEEVGMLNEKIIYANILA